MGQWSSVLSMAGGCHAMEIRWRTGDEVTPLILTSAHAELLTRAQTSHMDAIAIRMIMCGVRTAVCLQRNLTFPSSSWGLEIIVVIWTREAITLLENWLAMDALTNKLQVWTIRITGFITFDCHFPKHSVTVRWLIYMKELLGSLSNDSGDLQDNSVLEKTNLHSTLEFLNF